MRKTRLFTFVLCAFILLLGSPLYSYELELGLKAGMVRSMAVISRDLPGITIDAIDELSFGSFLSFFFIGDQLGLQPEIYYSVKGFDAQETDQGQVISSRYKISYIKIPLLVSYKLPLKGRLKPGVVFGPYFGFARKVMEVQSAFGQTEERELGDNLKETDVGLVFGGNVRYSLGFVNVILAARYNLGLVNISKDITEVSWDFRSRDTIKNRALTVMIGLAFNLSE